MNRLDQLDTHVQAMITVMTATYWQATVKILSTVRKHPDFRHQNVKNVQLMKYSSFTILLYHEAMRLLE